MSYVDDGKGLVIDYKGVVSLPEYLAARNEFHTRDKARFPCNYCLKDMDEASFERIPSNEIRVGAMRYWKDHDPPELVCAFVVSDVLNYGIARMWQSFVDQAGWEV